jgi:hypothetical protein
VVVVPVELLLETGWIVAGLAAFLNTATNSLEGIS